MTHVFLLILVVGSKTVSNDMHFYDINRCNWFASQVVKRYGNYKYYRQVPADKKATAYCEPRLVNPNDVYMYE